MLSVLPRHPSRPRKQHHPWLAQCTGQQTAVPNTVQAQLHECSEPPNMTCRAEGGHTHAHAQGAVKGTLGGRRRKGHAFSSRKAESKAYTTGPLQSATWNKLHRRSLMLPTHSPALCVYMANACCLDERNEQNWGGLRRGHSHSGGPASPRQLLPPLWAMLPCT